MKQKDYIKIAAVLNSQFNRPHESATALGMAIMESLCLMLKIDNNKFDQAKFEKAVYKVLQ